MKILLIDDNLQITKMLTTFFDLKGHECVSVNDGKSGLELIKERNFDIILLDLAMPEFTGYDVIDTLEKEGKLKENKIIVFTASNISQSELDKLLKRGVYSYMLKPTDLDGLLEKITQSL